MLLNADWFQKKKAPLAKLSALVANFFKSWAGFMVICDGWGCGTQYSSVSDGDEFGGVGSLTPGCFFLFLVNSLNYIP